MTVERPPVITFVSLKINRVIHFGIFKDIAFTHKHIDLQSLGKLVICEQTLDDRLRNIQSVLGVKEIFYVGTYNRVEFVFTSSTIIDRILSAGF